MNLLHLTTILSLIVSSVLAADCVLRPLGDGQDDTDQILAAMDVCGTDGTITLNEGNFNITRKMTWNLTRTRVDLYGTLNFIPDIDYWLQENSTYRVVFIQSQASWFVVTGRDFVIDAHNRGGINGNGQPWWEYFTTVPRQDGDGRPLSLTLYRVNNGTVKDFSIEAQPFWCNTVAESTDVIYDGMSCNATNTNPEFFGQNIVPNTDGIDTYRSTNIQLLNWDITCGDDCIAIKGNTTNLFVNNITCRGGDGVAFGSLGQYFNLTDNVDNVTISNALVTRINSTIQPLMHSGLYMKAWSGAINGVPPVNGGGGSGTVSNARFINFTVDDVDFPTQIDQTYGGNSTDNPSKMQFVNITWENWTGIAANTTIVDLECSSDFPCDSLAFVNFGVIAPLGGASQFICNNTVDVTGISC